MKYTSENIERLVKSFVCADSELQVIGVDSVVNASLPGLSIKQIDLGSGYSMLVSIDKESNEVIKHSTMYTRVIECMTNIEKLHVVV